MSNNVVFFEDVTVGMALSPMTKHPTNLQLFRFSAATYNGHRIHYDRDYAASEGYPNVLVQSHLHGSFLMQTVMAWAGTRSRITAFKWQNRAMATPDDTLTCTGRVVKTEVVDGVGYVECELEERNQKNELCTPGWARITLPRRS